MTTSGTRIASAVTLGANARSIVRVTSLRVDREKLGARSRHRPQHVLGGLLDRGRKRCVAEILGEGLPLVRPVPGEAQDGEALGLVAEVLREQEERERADRPCVGTRRVRDRDLGRLALQGPEVGRLEAVGRLGGGVEARLDVLACGVLHDAVAELVLDGVDELSVADCTRRVLFRAGDARVAAAAAPARLADLSAAPGP